MDPIQRVDLWRDAPCDFEGFLSKQGATGLKLYKKRYFKLVDRYLFYFKDDLRKNRDQKPQGYIDLTCTKLVEDLGHRSGFCVTGPQLPRTYFLQADNDNDKKLWWDSLMAIVDKITPDQKRRHGTDEQLPTKSTLLLSRQASEGSGDLQDFQLLTVIGRGSFGKVIKVKHKPTGKLYAMKILRKDLILKENMVEHTKAEKSILQQVDHPFIVTLEYAFQTPDKLYLILDYLPGGELFFHLQKSGKFSETQAKQYIAELALALDHLHSLDIVYRDLKPENCVLDSEGFVVLTDFGLAKKCLASQPTYTFCGTPEYLAPEILQNKGHSKAVDWWSLGVLLYEMLFGLPPFYSDNVSEMYQQILKKDLSFPAGANPDVVDLLQKFMTRDPKLRLQDGEKIKRHPWFSDIEWDKLLRREITPVFRPDCANDVKNFDTQFTRERAVISVCHAPFGQAARLLEEQLKDFSYNKTAAAAAADSQEKAKE